MKGPYFRLCFMFMSLSFSMLAQADIVGGDEVGEEDPVRASTTALYTPSRDGRSGSLCTASIIGKDTAITAAHCIEKGGLNPVMIFGRDAHSPRSEKRAVTGAVVNPTWTTKQGRGMDQGDIAVVKFDGGTPAGYHAVKTAQTDEDLEPGEKTILAGYGISDTRRKSGAGVLRRTDVSVENPRKGKSEMILDQSHGHGACHGDSGGPAFVRRGGKPVLAGVTNRSHPAYAPDDCGHKVVYTKVSAYKDWIQKSQRDLDHPSESPARQLQKRVHTHTTLLKSRVAKVGKKERSGSLRRRSQVVTAKEKPKKKEKSRHRVARKKSKENRVARLK